MERSPRSGDLPAALGRYEVIARLETGGMAEILLGRLTGPSGFERAVVIKRILPSLAEDLGFVEMFLDEARIVAGIRHPNVVQVQELGSEAGELYQVLEYLEGETVASLLRRLRARGETLPPALAAHIAAEACAGLHAAHELATPDGKPQNLVHRDVSPSNVFVTYGGAVKILDFGIAKAADRIARTDAGQLKGKLAYMSPEQAHGHALDRRSDLYSLGVVLYELSTGHNPLLRATDVATLEAVRKDFVVPPSRFLPAYPAELEAVCLRALARDPAERYPTAAEMRRDLLAALRTLAGDSSPVEALARLMREIFADQMGEKRELLGRMRGTQASARPPARVGRMRAALAGAAAVAALAIVAVVAAVVAGRGPAPSAQAPAPAPSASAAVPASADCAGSAVRVSGLRAAWTTPGAIHWTWDLGGSAGDLLRLELVVGADAAEVAARAASAAAPVRAARVWAEADRPELGRFELPRTEGIARVESTVTDGHAPDTVHYGRLAAVDTRGCRSLTETVAARTALAPYNEIALVRDHERPRSYTIPSSYTFVGTGPDAGHYEYRSRCPAGQEACWANLRVAFQPPIPVSLREGPLSQGFIEMALDCTGSHPSFWTEITVCFGTDCKFLCTDGCVPGCESRCDEARAFIFAPLTLACGGHGPRIVQIPLRALVGRPVYGCQRPSVCRPTAEGVSARGVGTVWVGGLWPRDAVVRVDDVRIRW